VSSDLRKKDGSESYGIVDVPLYLEPFFRRVSGEKEKSYLIINSFFTCWLALQDNISPEIIYECFLKAQGVERGSRQYTPVMKSPLDQSSESFQSLLARARFDPRNFLPMSAL